MGLCVSWRAIAPGSPSGPTLRVLTCNVHGRALDPAALRKLIAQTAPDIVALQEFSPRLRQAVFADDPWFFDSRGELFLASRYPILDAREITGPKWHSGAAVMYRIELPGHAIRFCNLHLASPHGSFDSVLGREPAAHDRVQANIAARLDESLALSEQAGAAGASALLAGDFNMPCDSAIYRACWGHFSDAFASAGFGFGYTYRIHRTAVRIDHILSGQEWRCRSCRVVPTVGSPHRPLIAEFEWLDANR